MHITLRFTLFLGTLMLISGSLLSHPGPKIKVTPEEARTIAKEAYIYGYPLVDGYRIMYNCFVDRNSPEFLAPMNQIKNRARISTPGEKAVQTPDSDAPYSILGMDLRTEPMVITVPAMEKNRNFSVQFIDAYAFHFNDIGSLTTGNDGGSFLVMGPNWKGETPRGVNGAIQSELDFALALFRTQLLDPADIEIVKKIQRGYKVESFTEFLGQPEPTAAPTIDFIRPISIEDQKKSLAFFSKLNFWLQFCPTNPTETELMSHFAKIGVGGGLKFDAEKLSPKIRQAIEQGMQDAWKELEDFQTKSINTGKVTRKELSGTREFLNNNYLYRFAGAVLGIWGN